MSVKDVHSFSLETCATIAVLLLRLNDESKDRF